MFCTNAINTSNTTTQTGAAERHSSGLDSNSCYCVFIIILLLRVFHVRQLYKPPNSQVSFGLPIIFFTAATKYYLMSV